MPLLLARPGQNQDSAESREEYTLVLEFYPLQYALNTKLEIVANSKEP